MSELARVSIERRGPVTVARIDGELDMSNAERVLDRLAEAVGAGPLVLDLARVEYLDSAFLAATDRLARRLGGEAGLRLVCPPSAPGRRTLEAAGVDRLLPVHPSADEALRALRAPAP